MGRKSSDIQGLHPQTINRILLAPPIKTGNKWLTTGVFPSPAAGAVVTAPGSRNQELKKLTLEITNWALDPKSFPFS